MEMVVMETMVPELTHRWQEVATSWDTRYERGMCRAGSFWVDVPFQLLRVLWNDPAA